jgi:hypothetical protein
VIAQAFGAPIEIDDGLREIDYKLRTGAICVLEGDADAPTISMWSHSPRVDRHFS